MTELTYQSLKDMYSQLLRQKYPPDVILIHIDDLLYIMRELRKSGYRLVRQINERGEKLSIYDVFTEDYQEKANFEVYVDKMRFGEPGKVYIMPDPMEQFRQKQFVYEKPADTFNPSWQIRFGTRDWNE